MLLAKRCYKEHNIKNGTLKLGTLHEYRNTEIEQIADKEEGRFSFKIKFDGKVKIESRWFNTLCGGMIKCGNKEPVQYAGFYNAYFDFLNFSIIDDDYVFVEECTAIITRDSLNSFIYCMSRIDEPHECINLFPKYNDQWYLSYEKVNEFAIEMGHGLLETIKKENAAGRLPLPEGVDADTLRLNVRHGDVIYTPRELHVTNETSFILEDLMKQMQDITYTKPPIPFQPEKEYRFQYTLISGTSIIVPGDIPMIINSERLQNLAI